MDQSRREGRKLSEVKGGLQHRLRELPAERQSAVSRPAELGFHRGYLVGIASTTTVMVTAAVVLVFGYVRSDFGPQATAPQSTGKALPGGSKDDETKPTMHIAAERSDLGSREQYREAKEATAAEAEPGKYDGVPERPNQQLASSKVPDEPSVITGSVVSPEERQGDVSTAVRPAVEAAQALMNTGRVQAARQQLIAIASSDGSPDAAWALARSYDPNHLNGIQDADAGPDVAEATRWYRTWYAEAVKQRLVTNSVSVEKIIGSMRP